MSLSDTSDNRPVFVSHSSKDASAANAVRETLEAAGIRCWIAPRDIAPGQDWSEAIVAGLMGCRVTVLVFSENANASVQVRREVQFSFENGKNVIPWRITDILPTGAFAYYLNPVHWLNAFPPPLDAHLPALAAYVQAVLSGESPSSIASAVAVSTPPPTPAAETPTTPTGNLPEALAPLIGRTVLLPEWQSLVTDPANRLVTLCAFGGMGKSRSALEIAHRSVESFSDGGVWWVELDGARSETDLLERIAGALSLSLSAQPAAMDQVGERLRSGGRTLLVLDNTEQIETASRAISKLLKVAPKLVCLVTTRCALEISGEKVAEVPPLTQEEGEALFLDRAQARHAAFERTPDNAGDLAELVRHLDGVPLAIELAAARVGAMTPRDILNRLSDRFRLLRTSASHLPERQRTLTGAIEWSYELLSEDTRNLLAQVSVFAGGFTLEVAEQVCLDLFDVFEGIHELRRQSLLRAEIDPKTQQVRFSQLEFLRDWGTRKLVERGPEFTNAVRDRHARFYLEMAEERVKALRTAGETEAQSALTRELPNLRAALENSVTGSDPEITVRLALALYLPLYDRGYWDELARVLETGLRTAEATGKVSPELRAQLSLRYASVLHDRGDLLQARTHAEASLAKSDAGVVPARNLLGLIAEDEGRPDEAEQHFRTSLDRCGEEDDLGQAHAIYNLARLASKRGDQERARSLYEESLVYRRQAGDRRGEAKTLVNLGAVAFLLSDYAEARRLYEQGLFVLSELDDRQGVATLLYNLAELAEKEDDMPLAVGLYFHSLRLFRALPSALASLPEAELSRLREALGPETFEAACANAESRPWKTLC
ncbi:MAG: tetratricopeptide repeat protein [Capsulimonadales bacterium]|nr:tetratricopeptide repeat protein [Capsulimonadales bacterium]